MIKTGFPCGAGATPDKALEGHVYDDPTWHYDHAWGPYGSVGLHKAGDLVFAWVKAYTVRGFDLDMWLLEKVCTYKNPNVKRVELSQSRDNYLLLKRQTPEEYNHKLLFGNG
jgi:hypothetical protein